MEYSIISEEITFLPAEIEKISGVSPVLLRNWRRRGFFPKKGAGWSRLGADDVAQLLVMKELSEMGIGPSSSLKIAKAAGLIAIIWAMQWPESVGFIGSFSREEEERERKKYIIDIDSKRFLIAFKNGELKFTGDPKNSFDNHASWEEGFQTAVILDLHSFGTQFLEKTGRPILIITKSEKT